MAGDEMPSLVSSSLVDLETKSDEETVKTENIIRNTAGTAYAGEGLSPIPGSASDH